MMRLSLLLFPGLLSVSVSDPTVSEKALAELGGWESWTSCGEEVPFKLQGKWGVCSPTLSHASESVLDYFSECGRAKPLVGKWMGPLEPRVWVCQKPGLCFYGSPTRKKCQSDSQESVWDGHTLNPISDTP